MSAMDEGNIYRHDSDSDSVNSWLSGSETDSASGNEESDDQDRSRSRPGASVGLVRGGGELVMEEMQGGVAQDQLFRISNGNTLLMQKH